MDFNNSKTKINLMRAFAGESQARNRYDMAAEAAKKEKYNILPYKDIIRGRNDCGN